MAPKTRQEEKISLDKKSLVHFKPKIKSNGLTSVPNSISANSCPIANKQKSPESYENLVLFYLNKLRYLFSNAHPQPTARENSALKMDKMQRDDASSNSYKPNVMHPCKYTSSNPPRPREDNMKSKIYKMVSAAIEYGYANDVLEKKGGCFYFKNKRPGLALRAPTPGPQSTRYCSKCCSLHGYADSNPQDGFMSRCFEQGPSNQSYNNAWRNMDYSRTDRNYRGRISNSPVPSYAHSEYCYRPPIPDNSKENQIKNVLPCPDCRALERLRK
ncbi:hypothetical protein D910_01178 [Dendroctonus ponderosae]